jgi:hypothetical protein
MNKFDFLAHLNPVAIVEEVKAKGKGKKPTPKNPEGMRLRIFKDGSIYPSQELVDVFDLEYMSKGHREMSNDLGSTFTGYGFDIFSSKDWGQYPTEAQQVLLIAAVPKIEPKVSVFGQVDYNEDGSPKKSVMEQGSKRPEIVEALREVYDRPMSSKLNDSHDDVLDNDLLFLDKNYVDLEINLDIKVFEGLSNYYIPKEIKKGAKKGEMSYEVRKNLSIFPLTIVEAIVEVETEEEVETESSVETTLNHTVE